MRDRSHFPTPPELTSSTFYSTIPTMRKKQKQSESLRLAIQKHEKWLKSMGAHPTQRTAKADRRSVAQHGSAPGLGPGGQRFESSHSDHPPKWDSCTKKQSMRYSGKRRLLGIATLHKSNLVPVFEKEDLQAIGKMRR